MTTRWLSAALTTALLFSPAAACAEDTVTGPAKVRDAVTMAIVGGRVRLAGIAVRPGDCGERSCDDAARDMLATHLASGPVTCLRQRRLGHGYYAGRCRDAAGADLNEALAQAGLVTSSPD